MRGLQSNVVWWLAAGLVLGACAPASVSDDDEVAAMVDDPPAACALPAPLEPKVSGVLPLAVTIPPSVTTPVQARPYFDVFSWQSFLAMVWPSRAQPRGEPVEPDDPAVLRNPPAGTTPVFSSYKEAYELFGQGDETPSAWASYDTPVSPCSNADYDHGGKTVVMASKSGTLLDEVNEAFSFPLIDQNGNYAWSEVRFNRGQYDFVRDNALYLRSNLFASQPVVMPASSEPDTQGALMVKATWRIMTDADDPSRYHTVQALLLEPGGDLCVPTRVGLVGLHVVQKLDQFPQWIWSSFEQVDNIERGHGAGPDTPISFNDGDPANDDPRGWNTRPPKVPPLEPPSQRTPVQVSRHNPIPTTPAGASTVDINTCYQELLAGTPWSYYQLIITQWPSDPSQFEYKSDGGVYPAGAGLAFPPGDTPCETPCGATNVVMETYVQTQADATFVGVGGGNSCMACHYGADSSDFSWVLANRSH